MSPRTPKHPAYDNNWLWPTVKASETVDEAINARLASTYTYYMDERDQEWLKKNNEEARREGTSAQGALNGTSMHSGRTLCNSVYLHRQSSIDPIPGLSTPRMSFSHADRTPTWGRIRTYGGNLASPSTHPEIAVRTSHCQLLALNSWTEARRLQIFHATSTILLPFDTR